MTYSCSDFFDDVMRCLADSGAIADGGIPENDVGAASDVAIAAIVTMHRASLSSNFVRELLGEVGTLGTVAEEHGTQGLAFFFYLQAAILNATFVEARSHEDSGLLELISRLPSGATWMKHIQVAQSS
ncbi:hypothetical protein ParKJ_41030 [Paraburkholderia fungorum]|jgi:hypothetical protein|uniref:Uncharacterized protein n=1 Tax=Paraburkholderia fungorum TaxID=134537 RepID=A0AAP5QHW6_9BURK|nr:hypothetical protein [Paraburkholderia fungorum]MDT8843786.1 hypothetical protein [Paraburkholderia fungorum]